MCLCDHAPVVHDRYLDEIPSMNGKLVIAPVPVFSEDMPRSLGLGGTGTVVTITAADQALAADWVAYAKLSEEGNRMVWEDLGFDPCNTALWTDRAMTHNPDNRYNQYFQNNVFDVLNEIKDEIVMVRSSSISPTINYLTTIVLNELFEDMLILQKCWQRLKRSSKARFSSPDLSAGRAHTCPSFANNLRKVRGMVGRKLFSIIKKLPLRICPAVHPDLSDLFCLSGDHHRLNELSGYSAWHGHQCWTQELSKTAGR